LAKFEVYRDSQEDYRWRLKANNHQIIAVSREGYKQRAECEHGIELVRSMDDPEVYEDNGKQFRWRFRASNGLIISDSGEGYKARGGCRRGIAAVRRTAPTAPVVG
jgi:uncharacterized protein YegP (UPF0339 family)